MSCQQTTLRLRVNAGSSSAESSHSNTPESSPHASSSNLMKEETKHTTENKRMAKPTYSTKCVFYPPSNKYWRIGNQWYDLAGFHHPGGSQVLEIARDRFDDATFAFEAHHHNYQKAQKVLHKYLVKDQARAQAQALRRPTRSDHGFPAETHHDAHLDANQHPDLMGDDTFYSVLRVRVANHLKEVDCPDGEPHWASIVFFWTIFVGWAGGMIATFTTGSFVPAFFTGIVATWLASYGHNWIHQPKYKHWGWGILSMDMVGLDSEVWFRDHVLHHHMFTNTPWDHHVIALDPFILQDQTRPRNWLQKHVGPLLLHVLFSIGTYSAFVVHFGFLLQGQEVISPAVVLGKLLWPLQHYLFYQQWGLHGLALMVFMTAVTGNFFYTIAFMNHNAEHCTRIDERNSSQDWGEAQLRSCADFGVHLNFYQSMLKYLLLNFHTVHHLFPKVDFCHHPAISEIMVQTAREFQIPYRCGNPWDLYWEMYQCYREPKSLLQEVLVYAGGNI